VANHSGYLLPTATKPPKHLFHLIIRYEGDGVINQNVVDVCKSCGLVSAAQEETKKGTDKPAAAKPASSSLFHFIVRYEGDGIIDKNVVDVFKAYAAAEGQNGDGKKPDNPPVPPPPPPPTAIAPVTTSTNAAPNAYTLPSAAAPVTGPMSVLATDPNSTANKAPQPAPAISKPEPKKQQGNRPDPVGASNRSAVPLEPQVP
jgi:hypothetical protein